MSEFLTLAFVFLVAGVIAVPLATRLGLGSVLGYLIAGIALSPLLGALGVDVVSIQHFAEFGVVMMLFLVGLELEPKLLWSMRARLLGLGGLQVVLTSLAITGVALMFQLPWQTALTIGLVLSLSSTAIVLQTLNEKGLMKSDGGQSSFSVLLFQDIAVIPMLALIPLLALSEPSALGVAADAHAVVDPHAVAEAATDAHAAEPSFVDQLQGWQRALLTFGVIAGIILGGRILTRPLFRFIELAHLRELFTAAALMLVVGIALLMGFVGLSAALGTFLAGVVLANSEYRHELESDLEPFKGLLLGLFFITVGASINFTLLGNILLLVGALTLLLMAIKFGVLFGLAIAFRIRGTDRFLFSMGLAQAGEFAFVLLSFTVANHVLPQDVASLVGLVVTLSMLLTPLLFILYDRVIAPRFSVEQEREADHVGDRGAILIAGHGRVGGIINRLARAWGHDTVVLDYSAEQLEMLQRFGIKVFYGDATRPDLLHAAGIDEAKVFVIAIDGRDQITELTRYVAKTYPHIHIVARAIDRTHVYELWAAGCRDIVRETFDSSVRLGRSVLEALGEDRDEAQRKVDEFVSFDRMSMRELADAYRSDIPSVENEEYVAKARRMVEAEGQLLRGEISVEDLFKK